MPETSAITLEKTDSQSSSVTKGGFKWRKYLTLFSIFLLLIYLLSLVVLNTSWVKSKFTDRLEAKSKSKWELGSVMWIPFGDIQLNDIETSMGEGGVKIKSLNVKPSWNDLFSGSVNLREATAKDAEVDIDLKWIRQNLSDLEETAVLPERDKPTKREPVPQPQPQPPKVHKDPSGKPAPKPTGKPVLEPASKPEVAVKKETEIDDLPNQWLKVENLNFTLRNGKEVIERVTDVSASIPIGGKPVDGDIKFNFLGHDHVQKVSWNGRSLMMEEKAGKLFDVNFHWAAVCNVRQSGVPFVFRFVIPQQKLNHKLDKPNVHVGLSSDKIAANFILNGSLRHPNTWRGILNAGSESTVIVENQKTHKKIEFDYTRMVGTIANGVIHIPVAEAIGHKMSILANGSIHKNLYSYGVLRLITNDESKTFFDRVYHATHLINIDQSRHHFFSPLDTPDRQYCDIYLDGKLTDLEARHHRSESWQPLNLALKKLLDFKNNELQEDGLLEAGQ